MYLPRNMKAHLTSALVVCVCERENKLECVLLSLRLSSQTGYIVSVAVWGFVSSLPVSSPSPSTLCLLPQVMHYSKLLQNRRLVTAVFSLSEVSTSMERGEYRTHTRLYLNRIQAGHQSARVNGSGKLDEGNFPHPTVVVYTFDSTTHTSIHRKRYAT